MKKSAYFSNIFFVFCIVSVGFLCVLRYLRVTLLTACVFGVIAGFCGACFTALILKNKREQHLQKADDERLKEKFLLHLILLPVEKRNEFLNSLFPCRIENGVLVSCEKVAVFPVFLLREVTPNDLLPILQVAEYPQKQIYCDRISADAKSLCERADIEIIDGVQLFQMAKEKNLLPQAYVSESLFLSKKKEFFKLCFAKSNSMRFTRSGFFILLFSLITPFSLYYLIVGFSLLFVAIFIKIFGKD